MTPSRGLTNADRRCLRFHDLWEAEQALGVLLDLSSDRTTRKRCKRTDICPICGEVRAAATGATK